MAGIKTANNGKLIGLMTTDFYLFHELAKALKIRDIPFISLNLGEDVPAFVGAVITTSEELERVNFPLVVVAEDFGYPKNRGREIMDTIVDHALVLTLGKRTIEHLVVGIDPGKRPGLALFADGIMLHTIHTTGPEHAVSLIEALLDIYPGRKILVRIGDGAPRERNIIINALLDLGIAVEMVNEDSTSARFGKADTMAAAAIGKKGGRRVTSRLRSKITRGQIRYLQDQSRIVSNGQITISSTLAREVAGGHMSLEEAVNIQKGGEKRGAEEQ